MTNENVIADFLDKTPAKTKNLYTDGTRLINYSTCIGEFVNGRLYINVSKYSASTSRIQNKLIKYSHWYNPILICNINKGVQHLSKIQI